MKLEGGFGNGEKLPPPIFDWPDEGAGLKTCPAGRGCVSSHAHRGLRMARESARIRALSSGLAVGAMNGKPSADAKLT
jgi:hypothetical protein